MDYQQKYKYISEQLNVLKTEMDDLKREDKVTRNDLIHEENIRHGRESKRRMLEQVKGLSLHKHTDTHSNYVTLIGVHELHGQMHPNAPHSLYNICIHVYTHTHTHTHTHTE